MEGIKTITGGVEDVQRYPQGLCYEPRLIVISASIDDTYALLFSTTDSAATTKTKPGDSMRVCKSQSFIPDYFKQTYRSSDS